MANRLRVLPDLCRRHPGRAIGVGAALVALAVLPFTPYFPGEAPDSRRQADPGHSAEDPAADHRGAIGDPRTVDPCALVKPESFVRFGETELDKDYGNFDRCDVIVTSGDSEVDIKVDLNSGPEPELAKPTRTVGSVGVVEESAESEECNRTLLPAGDKGHDVTVTAQQNGEGSAPLCDMSDEAVKVAR